MIGLIGYVIACFFVSIVLTMVFSMFKPIKKTDNLISWRVMASMFLIAGFAPYGYVELVTRSNEKEMREVVTETALSLTKQGKFDYFKVLNVKENKARVIAVVIERSKWGGDDRTVIAMNLEQREGKWEPIDFNWVTSDQRNRDGISLPPYW